MKPRKLYISFVKRHEDGALRASFVYFGQVICLGDVNEPKLIFIFC